MERIAVNAVCKTFTLKPGQTVTVDGVTSNRIAVLDGVDLSIDRGEFITLVGPSGSGKSVLLDVIAGLTGATSGVASIDGIEVSKPHARTAYVFQQYALFPWRTALQNVEYALEVRGVPAAERREKARHFLHLFGLKGFEDRFPSQLSGGHAAARGDRPRTVDRSAGTADGRAFCRARRPDAGHPAKRALAHMGADKDDRRLRHALDRRGDLSGRPRRGDDRPAGEGQGNRRDRSAAPARPRYPQR
ncbi:ATP-binding cassette domain-containing protein [Sinorhizobium meliloti]|nr:ATP-binding cassette domain-containing protein [Sinorhizobium meliloti]WKL40940.1 ATP-binding cassette domain-containing protein [Sinorhizobium meliloti]